MRYNRSIRDAVNPTRRLSRKAKASNLRILDGGNVDVDAQGPWDCNRKEASWAREGVNDLKLVESGARKLKDTSSSI